MGMTYNEALNAGRALVNAASMVSASAQEVGEAFKQMYLKMSGNGLAQESLASMVSKRDANKIHEVMQEKEENLTRPGTAKQKEPYEIFDPILPNEENPYFSDEEWNRLLNSCNYSID